MDQEQKEKILFVLKNYTLGVLSTVTSEGLPESALVGFAETMEDTVTREIKEELDIDIRILKQFGCANHIMPKESQHWVSTIFLCEIATGEPKILEPGKCDEIGWFALAEIANLPLGVIMKENLKLIEVNE